MGHADKLTQPLCSARDNVRKGWLSDLNLILADKKASKYKDILYTVYDGVWDTIENKELKEKLKLKR